MAGIFKTPTGYTVQIPRGAEVYDPATGQLVDELHLSEDEFKTFSKPITDKRPVSRDGRAGWLNSQTLPAGLRDLVAQGDSELDYDHAATDRPAALKALDKAAFDLGDDGAPVTAAIGANLMPPPAPEPDHPVGTATAAAGSVKAHQSPPGARNAVSAEDAQKAFEEAERRRSGAANVETESARSAVTPEDTAAAGGDADAAAERAAAREKAKENDAAKKARATA